MTSIPSPPAGRPFASVLLPTKNGGPLLGRVLASVFRQEAGFPFEVIVIDSGSTDGSLERMRQLPLQLHQIPPETFDHGGTRNKLAELAKGEVLVFLTQDAVPANRLWLHNLVKALGPPSVAGAYARQRPRPDTDPVTAFFQEERYPPGPRVKSLADEGPTIDLVFFSNASSAMKRSVWKEIPFPEKILMAEDQDWSVRALERGYGIAYAADAEVEHAHHYPVHNIFRRYFDSGVTYREIFERSRAGESYGTQVYGRGFYHVQALLKHLSRTGHRRWILRAILVSLAQFGGLYLGHHHRLIPRGLKRGLSWHASFWRQDPSKDA